MITPEDVAIFHDSKPDSNAKYPRLANATADE
jgi:hypothetical protein